MAEKKKIPCRVCRKLFEPCSYCQSHADVFRWRNFACSRECALKYIDDTIAYRESLKCKEKEHFSVSGSADKPATAKKRTTKKISIDTNESNIESEHRKTE